MIDPSQAGAPIAAGQVERAALFEPWPSAAKMLAIADVAESLAETIWRSVLTTDQKSPARLPCFAESLGAVHEAIRHLDALCHGRSTTVAAMDFPDRWKQFLSIHQLDPSIPPTHFGLSLEFHEWEMHEPSRPGDDELSSMFEDIPPATKMLVGSCPVGWKYAVRDPFTSLWRVLRGLKVYFGQTPVFSLNAWEYDGEVWVRIEDKIDSSQYPPLPKEEVGSDRKLRRMDDGLPIEWLDGLKVFARHLREEVLKETSRR